MTMATVPIVPTMPVPVVMTTMEIIAIAGINTCISFACISVASTAFCIWSGLFDCGRHYQSQDQE